MSNIEVLTENVRNIIAAGEVVERPSSVVKELVENSIDADASEIIIEVEDGGAKRISVTDNGFGMSPEDLKLCIERHATSKLKNADDLDDIRTMGFRGEAIPSIAAVSIMSIKSRLNNADNISGYELCIRGGTVEKFQECGMSFGTKVNVESLFYNVPARKKFMRTAKTELGHIKDMIERLALANSNVRFKLVSNGKEIINAFAIDDQKQRASEILGTDVTSNCYQCFVDAGEIAVHGIVGDPSLVNKGKTGIFWFVNRRPIRDRLLNHAILEAYRSLLPRGVKPCSVLFVDIAKGLVDVNVHPAKSEVKFLKGNAVHDLVFKAVKMALQKQCAVDSAQGVACPALGSEARGDRECQFQEYSSSEQSESRSGLPKEEYLIGSRRRSNSISHYLPNYDNSVNIQKDCLTSQTCNNELPESSNKLLIPNGRFSSLRPIGQFHKTYILCESTDQKLIIIDQHAAHERIGYEKLKRDFRKKSVQGQRLLIPEVVEVASKSVGYLEDSLEFLNKIGWEVDYFGGNSFCIKSVPAILGNVNVKNVLVNMAEELGLYKSIDSYEEKLDQIMKVTACHAQIRAGDKLSITEIEHLLREMDEFAFSDRCPHGRRAYAEFELKEVLKMFDRM